MEHVYEKIINLDNESQTTSSSANDKPGEQEKEEDMAMLAEEKIELMCQDQVSSPSLPVPLRTASVHQSDQLLTIPLCPGIRSQHGPANS